MAQDDDPLARTDAGEETAAQLEADLARLEAEADVARKNASAALADVEEARGKLQRAKNEQKANKLLCDEAVAAWMAAWLREREAMARFSSCGGGIMLL